MHEKLFQRDCIKINFTGRAIIGHFQWDFCNNQALEKKSESFVVARR
jgi:hypothetical protein